MNTKEWNLLDKFISKYRLWVAAKYIEDDDVVLDLGCGVQHYLLTCGKNKFRLGYGLDYDVKDSQEGNIHLLSYKYQGRLPLKEGFFDKVFLLAVLEHIEVKEVQALFFEFSRVLKKKGRVIITTPTPRAKAVLEFLAFKLKVVTAEEVTDHKHYYTAKEIYGLADACGLRVSATKLFQLGLNSLYVLEKP
ncbi:MAG: methyltransferase domain-containing protein [Candidatus Omnitrophica bacterium]|nr:methyltransferase domain-containing protein [Candidatus Omnitrophota bacterium]